MAKKTEYIVLTKEALAAVTRHGGFTTPQAEHMGVKLTRKGWNKALLGKAVTKSWYDELKRLSHVVSPCALAKAHKAALTENMQRNRAAKTITENESVN